MALPQVATERRSASGFPLDYYGGQIMFRPTATDPFLYVVTGAAQTDGQLEAKILRFSVGDKPSGMCCLFFFYYIQKNIYSYY